VVDRQGYKLASIGIPYVHPNLPIELHRAQSCSQGLDTSLQIARCWHPRYHIISQFKMARPGTLLHQEYTVGWVCALPIELAASKAVLDEEHTPPPGRPGDENSYTVGRIGEHNVVMTCLPIGVIGTASAARAAASMLGTFRMLRFGLMVGIGGGVPSEAHDIRLGDIVVSKPSGRYGGVIQYDFGKIVQGGRFDITGSLNKPSNALLTAVSNLAADHLLNDPQLSRILADLTRNNPSMKPRFSYPGVRMDQLYKSRYDHPPGKPRVVPNVMAAPT
jgi:Phosphorylase superfamily